jgi:hypothetical protein
MAQAENIKAADQQDEAAKRQRSAVENHGKDNHAESNDCCGKTVTKSGDAIKASTKSAAAMPKT